MDSNKYFLVIEWHHTMEKGFFELPDRQRIQDLWDMQVMLNGDLIKEATVYCYALEGTETLTVDNV